VPVLKVDQVHAVSSLAHYNHRCGFYLPPGRWLEQT
jgi:hypothetical protein